MSASSLRWFRSLLEDKDWREWSGRDGSDTRETGVPWWSQKAALDRKTSAGAALAEQCRRARLDKGVRERERERAREEDRAGAGVVR